MVFKLGTTVEEDEINVPITLSVFRDNGMTVDLCMAYMLMAVAMTFTVMQGHNRSTNAQSQR